MAQGPETRLKIKVMKYLKGLSNCWAYKTSDKYSVGIPDIIICYKGHFVAIELKAGTKTTPMQDYVLGEIQKSGGYSEVCTSKEQVEKIIDTIDNFNFPVAIGYPLD